MLVDEGKPYGSQTQYRLLAGAIRSAHLIRIKALRLWMDAKGSNKVNISANCAVLAKEWAGKLNSKEQSKDIRQLGKPGTSRYDALVTENPRIVIVLSVRRMPESDRERQVWKKLYAK